MDQWQVDFERSARLKLWNVDVLIEPYSGGETTHSAHFAEEIWKQAGFGMG